MDLNNKLIGTHSNKITKIVPLWRHIINTIDNCQEIKRLSRYMTLTPLRDNGKDYGGKVKKQPNLDLTLTKDNSQGDKNLYDSMFDPDINTKGNRVKIFVSPYVVDTDNSRRNVYFSINILCEESSEELIDNKRTWLIAENICDLFDGVTINNFEYAFEDVGNVKFEISGKFVYSRISKTNTYMNLSIPLKANISSLRC